MPSIKELYRKIERKPQEFLIQSNRDTVIRGQMGTVLYIRANSFKGIPDYASETVTIKLREAYLLSDMIQDNLITTSNNRMIETQGMISIEAFTAKGKQTDLQAGKNITVFMPSDTIRPDVKIFNSRAPEHDGGMNWIINNNNTLSSFSLADLTIKFTPERNTECKIVFKKRKAILPGSNLGKNYTFKNIPKNEAVYIVALKYLNGQALLAIEEIKTAQITIEPNFQTYTLDELKEQLKKLDALGD